MLFRTCLVTKKKLSKQQLYRFTIQNGELIFDQKKINIGRGGYVEKNEKSIKKLIKLSQKIQYYLKTSCIKISPEIISQKVEKLKQEM